MLFAGIKKEFVWKIFDESVMEVNGTTWKGEHEEENGLVVDGRSEGRTAISLKYKWK